MNMAAITVATHDLLAGRCSEIQDLLSPFRKGKHIMCEVVRSPLRRDSKSVFAAHDGIRSSDDYRGWRFRTTGGLFCSYSELWKPDAAWKVCSLEHAAFTVHMQDIETRKEREFLGVHCEPQISTPTVSECCKQGPHLHVKADGFYKSHLPLDIWWLNNASRDLPTLTRVMKEIMRMIEVEVLARQ